MEGIYMHKILADMKEGKDMYIQYHINKKSLCCVIYAAWFLSARTRCRWDVM